MAQFPCEHCGRRYRGPGNRAYIAILDGVDRWDHKPRLCPNCLQELTELFDAVNGRIEEDEPTTRQPQPCLVCVQSVVGRAAHSAFMTSFAGRDVRTDFFAPLCAACRDQGESLLLGVVARP